MAKILIVDDSKAIHAFQEMCLRELGFTDIIHAYDGSEALALYTPDVELILLDWEMPVKNGPETLLEFRSKRIEVPIIIVTTKNQLQDITYMLEIGANDYIMKPFTTDIMRDKIQPFIDLSKIKSA